MKQTLKKIITKNRLIFDIFGIVIFGLSAFFLKIYKLMGVKNLKYSTKLMKIIGIFPIRNHYYEPQFNNEHLRSRIEKPIKNIHIFNEKKINKNLLQKFKYAGELLKLRLNKKNNKSYFKIDNPFFSKGDADFLYQFIRYTKPKKIIEIGSGYSTLISYEAIIKNKSEKYNCNMTCIDPGKIDIIANLKIKRIKKKVESCNISYFKKLKKNDLLIIDSTHIIKPFGDVLKIYQDIIPKINKGVNICIHDIFIPYSYPSDWVIDHNLFWNEQHLLETILMDKKKYKIIAPLFFLKKKYYSKLKKICPYLDKYSKPSSFYIKKII